jgi:hypothetical protein
MKELRLNALRWSGGFAALLAIALIVVLAAPSPLQPALACNSVTGGLLSAADEGLAPVQVVADAKSVAGSFYAHDGIKSADMEHQLIGTYLAAEDKDFLVIFNPGGWGWDPITDIPGWESIVNGIKGTLGGLGYSAMGMDYKRTRHGFAGVADEFEVLIGAQDEKDEELAARVGFLTSHLPGLHVILTGESNGAAVADEAMRLLVKNPQVYCIVSGPPVWHKCLDFERSLIIKNNGEQVDTFTTGDLILIMRANAESFFGINSTVKGDILEYIGAPGHFYSWDYPAVKAQVNGFLAGKFTPASKISVYN